MPVGATPVLQQNVLQIAHSHGSGAFSYSEHKVQPHIRLIRCKKASQTPFQEAKRDHR
jgi:hypothetical protein